MILMREGAAPKGLDWLLHCEKKKERRFYGLGMRQITVDSGLKQLKVISRREDRVPVLSEQTPW